jgi:hypothetical protein
MYKRLFVLLLLTAATVSTSTPVHASGPAIDFLDCINKGPGRLHCLASVSGGTGIYTYTWMPAPSYGSGGSVTIDCYANYQAVTVTVTDSSGATASRSGDFYCGSER